MHVYCAYAAGQLPAIYTGAEPTIVHSQIIPISAVVGHGRVSESDTRGTRVLATKRRLLWLLLFVVVAKKPSFSLGLSVEVLILDAGD